MMASMEPTNVSAERDPKREQPLRCSFCGKGHDDVRKLIASPTASICDECIKLCAELIADDATRELEPPR